MTTGPSSAAGGTATGERGARCGGRAGRAHHQPRWRKHGKWCQAGVGTWYVESGPGSTYFAALTCSRSRARAKAQRHFTLTVSRAEMTEALQVEGQAHARRPRDVFVFLQGGDRLRVQGPQQRLRRQSASRTSFFRIFFRQPRHSACELSAYPTM